MLACYVGVQSGVYRAELEKDRLERIRRDSSEAQANAIRQAETKKALKEIESLLNGELKQRWTQYDLCIKLGSARVNSAMKVFNGPEESELIVPQVIPEWLAYCLTGKFTPRTSKPKENQ